MVFITKLIYNLFIVCFQQKFTSQIFADISRSLVVVLQHLRFFKKILILIFFSDLFSVECKFFCPNSADNTMENRAISLVESSRDNSLISCPTSSAQITKNRHTTVLLYRSVAKPKECLIITLSVHRQSRRQ